VQQRGGATLHPGRLGVVRVEAQAEVAVMHLAGLQDLAVGVAAKLRHERFSPVPQALPSHEIAGAYPSP
jgi:hypothetical protein